MGPIQLIIPCTSNNYIGRLEKPHTVTKSEAAAAYKGRKLRRIVDFNMDVMDEVNGSDRELGPFLDAVL